MTTPGLETPAAQAATASGGSVPPPAAPAATPPAATDWTTGFNDDIKGYVQNKGWKDAGSLADSYRNLEKTFGVPADQIVKLPKDMSDAKAMEEVYNKLGRPGTPNDYKIAGTEGGNKEFAEWAKNAFHGTGLSSKQAEGLVAKWNEFANKTSESEIKALETKSLAEETDLKKEWGMAFDQKVKEAKRSANEFGLTGDLFDKIEKAVGFSETMKLFSNIGSKLGEPEFVTGKSNGFNAMTPSAAQAQIQALRSDPDFAKRLTQGSAAERKQWDDLHQMAYPG